MSKNLNKRISDLRAYLHLSQAAFAKPLNLSPTHIARFEKGVSVPSEETFALICSSFSVNPEYFETDMKVEDAVEKKSTEEQRAGIAAKLRTAREEKGWSQYELSDRSGVDRTIITRVENGEHLTEKQARKLAEALEVGVDWLMEGCEDHRFYPADEKMIEWLWENPEVREELWKRMKKDSE